MPPFPGGRLLLSNGDFFCRQSERNLREKVLITLLDVYSDFLTAVPLARRTAKHVELAIIQHAGLEKFKYCKMILMAF